RHHSAACTLLPYAIRPPPRTTPVPYTTLFRSKREPTRRPDRGPPAGIREFRGGDPRRRVWRGHSRDLGHGHDRDREVGGGQGSGDRKSTRLNSSHVSISYAVFCLEKKKGEATV